MVKVKGIESRKQKVKKGGYKKRGRVSRMLRT